MKNLSIKDTLKGKVLLPIKEYFKIIHPQYIILKITPDTSIRNYNSESIAKTIASMYKPTYQRIQKNEHFHLSYNFPEKVSFIIDISLNTVNFYIVCSDQYEKLIKEKVTETWNRATVTRICNIPNFTEQSLKYQLMYEKKDSLSLKVDKKTNEPLNSILNVLDVMEDDDRVGIMYNFIPCNQNGWKINHKHDLDKVKQGLPMEKDIFSWKYIFKNGGLIIIKAIEFITECFGDFLSNNTNRKPLVLEETALGMTTSESFKNLSKISKNKGDNTVLKTQMILFSDSVDKNRRQNNAIAVCEAYKTISEDNHLVYKSFKGRNVFYVNEFKVAGAVENTMSTLECQNLLEMPGRELLCSHKNIEKIDVLENPIPEELQKGYVYLGKSLYRGKLHDAYLRDEYNIGNLALLLLAPQGAGKTTFISNMVINANLRKECSIVIDYIKNCDLSNSIAKVVPKNDLCIIDLSKQECLQGLGFNEVKLKENATEFEMLEMSNMKTEQTMAFIDSINDDGKPLSGRMRRYLSSAGNVVYIQNDKSIGDVIKCLQNHKTRHEYIDYIKNNIDRDGQNYFEDMIDTLEELDEIEEEYDKKTKELLRREIVGTKDSKIDGILDRVNLLKENIYLKYMFSKSCKNNVDFVDMMEKGKTVLIKMPEDKFNNTMVKNVITTFFTSKIVLATKLRGALHDKPSRCNVFYDEISQAPTSEIVLRDVLSQLRKFGTKIIISAHYLDQLISTFKAEIIGSGASYMMLQGCDKKNFEELKEYLEPYELEDLINLKQFQSLNLIKYEKGFGKFITTLPKPPVNIN